jgi:hypothetical protein
MAYRNAHSAIAEAEICQPYGEQRDNGEAEDLGGRKTGKAAVGERKSEHEQRHHQKRGGAPAGLAQRGAGLMQQVQRHRGGGQ